VPPLGIAEPKPTEAVSWTPSNALRQAGHIHHSCTANGSAEGSAGKVRRQRPQTLWVSDRRPGADGVPDPDPSAPTAGEAFLGVGDTTLLCSLLRRGVGPETTSNLAAGGWNEGVPAKWDMS
jgi:hypothetical protein